MCKHNPNIDTKILLERSKQNRNNVLKSIKNGTHKHRSPTSFGTIECPHCGKIGKNIATMKRWHFDKCTNQVFAT